MAIGAGVALLVGFSAAWAVQGWRYGAQIAELKAAHAETVATDATQAVEQLQQAATRVADAASSARADNTATAKALASIRWEFRNALKPLPADCVPDPDRLRKRNAAIEAYNRAATGSVSGGALQND